MTKTSLFLTVLLLWIFSEVSSQLPHGGRPFPFYSLKSVSQPIVLTGFDLDKVLEESLTEDAISGKKPFRFAWNYTLEFTPENSGEWTEMSDGTKIWRLHLSSPGAFDINVDFNRYQLNTGSMVFIYPPDQSYYFGGFNQQNNSESKYLPTNFVSGDEIVIELQVKSGISDYGFLQIGSLAHAYIDVFGKKVSNPGTSGPCNVDINCASGVNWQVVKKAVCRLAIKSGSSTVFCTGALVNNTKQDTIPYLLTANHCISSAYQANTALFLFDFEADTCGKKVVSSSWSLAGSSLLATSDSIDFSLLRLNETPPGQYKPYYAGWSLSQVPAANTVCIHHPEGDLKKISIDTNPLTTEYQDPIPPVLSWLYDESIPQAFWRVINWETGTTEGGSSGAPLFNHNKLIVGNLTGGQANCTTPVNDYFSKFFVGWDHYDGSDKQLKSWLDPEGTGITNLTGFNPFGETDTIPIDTVEYAERFTLFPNPAYGEVCFETDSLDISGGYLTLYTLTGKKMAEYRITESVRLRFDVSFLPQGIYILKFSKDKIEKRMRLMVVSL